MTNRSLVLKNLIIVPALVRLVAKEVHCRVFDAAGLFSLVLEMLQAVGLVPSRGEDIKGDLSSDRVSSMSKCQLSLTITHFHCKNQGRDSRQPSIRKLLLEHGNKFFSNLVLLVVSFILIPLLHTRIPPHRTNINHPIPKLHKRAPLKRDLQIRNIMQNKPNQLLILFLPNPLNEAMGGERDAHFVGCEPVLGEAEVEHGRYGSGGSAELLLLLGEVGAADEADGYFLAEVVEELEHFGGYGLSYVSCDLFN
jgi:hypothetical protein